MSFGEWVQESEPTAYGILHLLPWDFGRMTPGEFESACKGWQQEQRTQYGMAAWAIANLINYTLGPKSTIQPADLLKSLDRGPRKRRNIKAEHEEIMKRFGRTA